jgi:AcrR family transcriptional regulator
MLSRLRRLERVEQNRDRVLTASERVFLARGYAGATLDAIAEDAGFSKGVVYSQFGSKPDLFFALLERRIEQRAADNQRAVAGLAGIDALSALFRVGDDDAASEPTWASVLTEFRTLAARDPDLSRRYSEVHCRTVDDLASVLKRVYDTAGLTPPVPVQSLAEFILAATTGAALERSVNPSALPDHDLAELAALALGFKQGLPPE